MADNNENIGFIPPTVPLHPTDENGVSRETRFFQPHEPKENKPNSSTHPGGNKENLYSSLATQKEDGNEQPAQGEKLVSTEHFSLQRLPDGHYMIVYPSGKQALASFDAKTGRVAVAILPTGQGSREAWQPYDVYKFQLDRTKPEAWRDQMVVRRDKVEPVFRAMVSSNVNTEVDSQEEEKVKSRLKLGEILKRHWKKTAVLTSAILATIPGCLPQNREAVQTDLHDSRPATGEIAAVEPTQEPFIPPHNPLPTDYSEQGNTPPPILPEWQGPITETVTLKPGDYRLKLVWDQDRIDHPEIDVQDKTELTFEEKIANAEAAYSDWLDGKTSASNFVEKIGAPIQLPSRMTRDIIRSCVRHTPLPTAPELAQKICQAVDRMTKPDFGKKYQQIPVHQASETFDNSLEQAKQYELTQLQRK